MRFKLRSKPFWLFCAFSFAGVSPATAAVANHVPTYQQKLNQVEALAEANSPLFKSSQAAAEAARAQAAAASAGMYPKLSLDANYSYQTYLPEINLIPNAPTITFGTHDSYTVGPSISYVLFNGKQTTYGVKSAKAFAQARSEDAKSQMRQVRYATKLAYFRAQLASENLLATFGALKLADSQTRDIGNQFKSGAASRLDRATAAQEHLRYVLQFQRAQSDLAAALRDLLAISGDKSEFDTSRPLPREIQGPLPDRVAAPTMIVSFEGLQTSLRKAFAEFSRDAASTASVSAELPELKSLEFASQAATYQSESLNGSRWPLISLSARSVLSYPDVVLPQQIQNNIFAVNFTLPLFDASLSKNLSAQQESLALASKYQREQKLIDLNRDLVKLRDMVASLRAQDEASRENAKRADEVAKLTYSSYRNGRSRYLDVQMSYQRRLEAQFGQAQIQYQLLTQLAEQELLVPGRE